MNQLLITTVDGLEPADAVAVARRLTKPGSEFQLEVLRVLSGELSSATPIALWNRDGALIGWACSHVWREQQTLEMFVDERHRGRGVASTLASMLAAAGEIDATEPIAVFSETTQRIAERLGMKAVRYARSGTDWVLA